MRPFPCPAPIVTLLAYFCAAWTSIVLTRGTDGFGVMWPASGILLAALLIAPRAHDMRYLLAAGIASLAANLLAGEGAWNALVYTVINLIEPLIAVRVWRLGGTTRPPDMTRPRDVGRMVVAMIVAATASATLATVLSGHARALFLLSWFATVLLGMLIVTPLVLTACKLLRAEPPVAIGRGSIEVVALLGLMLAVSIGVFGQSTYPLLFLPMLAQIAVTYRLGAFGAAAGVVIVAATGSICTATGHGPLMMLHGQVPSLLLYLQMYLLSLLVSALPLAALLAKRDALMAELRTAHAEAARTAALAVAAADTDPLTGLASRRRILADLTRALAGDGPGAGLCVALLDIDHFKAVNDRHGHLTGDAVLRRVAHAIAAALGPGDAVGRFGGEEFLIVLNGADRADMVAAGERIRRAVAESTPAPGEPVATASIGVAVAECGDDADQLIERADRALYAAKLAGRNRLRMAA